MRILVFFYIFFILATVICVGATASSQPVHIYLSGMDMDSLFLLSFPKVKYEQEEDSFKSDFKLDNLKNTWILIEEKVDSLSGIQRDYPSQYIYLLGPFGSVNLGPIKMPIGSHLYFEARSFNSLIGADYPKAYSEPRFKTLYTVFILDLLVRGLLVEEIPPDAFLSPQSKTSFDALKNGENIPIYTDKYAKTLVREVSGSCMGEVQALAWDIGRQNEGGIISSLGRIISCIAVTEPVKKAVSDWLLKNFSKEIANKWASRIAGSVAQIFDLPTRVFLLNEIRKGTSSAVPFSWVKAEAAFWIESKKTTSVTSSDQSNHCEDIKSDIHKPQATAIVFDHSGSMNEEKKIVYAKEAAFTYAKNMAQDDLLSVSIFSNNASTPAGLELLNWEGLSAEWISRLVGNNPGGGTNIGAGLSKGLDQLCSISGEKVKKDGLLLSDGMNNVGEYDSIVQKYFDYKIPIHTVKFGKHASEENLKKIAVDTGGTYSDADQYTVTNAYSAIFNAINGNSAVFSSHDLMGLKDQLVYQADISLGAEYLNLNASWQGSRLKVLLTSPSGNTYTGNNLPGQSDRYEVGKISQFTQIRSPESGTWSLDVQWDVPPTNPERVNLLFSEHTGVYTSILGFSPEYAPGQKVTINVHAAELDGGNNKKPLRDAKVWAEVQIPGEEMIRMIQAQGGNFRMYEDILQDIRRDVELFDDGLHNDYKAGDGIFGGFFTETQINGSYIVTAHIEGQKEDGSGVNRQSVSSFQVGPLNKTEVTTSQIMQYTQQIEEKKLKSKVVKPLGTMQNSSDRASQTSPVPKSSKKKRSRSLMDKLSN